MTQVKNDPIGQAILDFAQQHFDEEIIVSSDICDDDVIPVPYLFREFDEMPEIEQLALNQCSGRILDVGAGSGTHALYLAQNGFEVKTIDTSKGSCEYMSTQGLDVKHIDFFDYNDETFNTILMMMNGIGIAGRLDRLEATLLKAKSLLKENGKILCDSSDIKYLYEDDEGGMWIDLSAAYYGNFRFQMKYKDHISDEFDWLYVDFNNLEEIASRAGFKARKLYEADDHYLAELIKL